MQCLVAIKRSIILNMEIGILTFHWATNYGAILQAYCLQEYLIALGHEASIINYKPKKYDFSWFNFIRHPGLLKTIGRQLTNHKKERLLIPFRTKYLKTTKRYYSLTEFGPEINNYDVLISGSDQVLNPYFTMHGEDGTPTSVYWLKSGKETAKRIGYAVSFGCEIYPEKALSIASTWSNGFDAIGVREKTGLYILEQIGYEGKKNIVPDPTILIGRELFRKLGISIPTQKDNYTCVYMLRHEIRIKGDVKYIDDNHKPLAMEQWIQTIINAKQLITNSYHGTIMAIIAHVPFAVLLETGSDRGMNDRFYTLLTKIGVKDRLSTTIDETLSVLQRPMDFAKLDIAISKYRIEGERYISDNIITSKFV